MLLLRRLGSLPLLSTPFSILLLVAAQVNHTIDDTNGDSVTGVKPTYNPSVAGIWAGPSCGSECVIHPDPSQAFDGTFSAATYKPQNNMTSISIEIPFTGEFFSHVSMTMNASQTFWWLSMFFLFLLISSQMALCHKQRATSRLTAKELAVFFILRTPVPRWNITPLFFRISIYRIHFTTSLYHHQGAPRLSLTLIMRSTRSYLLVWVPHLTQANIIYMQCGGRSECYAICIAKFISPDTWFLILQHLNCIAGGSRRRRGRRSRPAHSILPAFPATQAK